MLQEKINLQGSYSKPEVADDTYEVKVKDIRFRHVEVDRYTGGSKDVLDFDFEILSGSEKGVVLSKGFVTPKITPSVEGRSASNLYLIISGIFGEPDEEALSSYRSGGTEFLNSLVNEELRIVTKGSKIINYLTKKK